MLTPVEIVKEFLKGCSCGGPGECPECLEGFIKAIRKSYDHSDRQLTLRALAIQSLRDPGFEYASREIAKKLEGEAVFDSFRGLLVDCTEPAERWPVNLDRELGDEMSKLS